MVSSIVRASILALVAAWAAESFVLTGRVPHATASSPKAGKQLGRTSPTSGVRSGVARFPLSAAYEGGSSEYGGGEMGASAEMELQELIVDFTDDGRVLLEVKGVKGQECRAITEDLIKALGDVITTENTEEYFEEKVVNVLQDPIQLGWSYDSNKPEW